MYTAYKYIILPLIISAVFLHYSCGNSVTPKTEAATEKFRLSLSQDSGYICAAEAFDFLANNGLIATINVDNHIRYAFTLDQQAPKDSSQYYMKWYHERADTIGKYYVFDSTGNYLAAISSASIILLFELNPQGEIISHDMIGHGNYSCCWQDFDDMLKKYNSYFGVVTCGTGMSYCAKYVTFFKDGLTPQSASVPLDEFVGALPEMPGHFLRSTLEFKADSLIVHYTLEKYLDDGEGNQKTTSTERITVTYIFGDHGFETEEEHKLEGILS